MKTFNVDFTLYDSVRVENNRFEIEAISLEELKDTVISIIEYHNCDIEEWSKIEKDIYQSTLITPVIYKTTF